MKTLVIFIALNIINVILQTVKSLVTNKGGKYSASIVNAIAYGLYTVVLVYMTCELSTVTKALIVGGCNLVGVYIVKSLEEKTAKKKIYKVEFTVTKKEKEKILSAEKLNHYNIIEIGNMYIFNFYLDNKADLKNTKEIINRYNGKYIVTVGEI